MRAQSDFTFYKNAQTPLNGTVAGPWACPGNALSASSHKIHASQGLTLISARWLLVWNPNNPVAQPVGVRLVKCDDGPTNLEQIARIDGYSYTNPRTNAVDITTELQTILATGVDKQLLMQTYGNDTYFGKIYSSIIECVWGDPAP